MKKVLASVLALAMLTGAAALAAPLQGTNEGTSGEVTLQIEVAAGYIVNIPASGPTSLVEGAGATTETVSVTKCILPENKKMTVSVKSTHGTKLLNGSSSIDYKLTVGESEVTDDSDTELFTVKEGDDIKTKTGTVKWELPEDSTNTATKAGMHSDTLTFTVAIASV